MAVIDQHHVSVRDENRCAAIFCLSWVGFFALVGLFSYAIDML